MFGRRVEEAIRRGLRHVSYARPGYVGSDRLAGRSIADCVGDVASIADQLGASRFYTVGTSGGAPHALACAALLPDRVLAAASIAGCAPWPAENLDWAAGMGASNIEEQSLAIEGEDALLPWLQREARDMRESGPEDLEGVLGDLASEADRRVLTEELAAFICSSLRESVRTGVWGWLDDDLAFVKEWGFDSRAIRVPLSIWHGARDRFVPSTHGAWLAQKIPDARWHLLPDRGHFLAPNLYGEIFEELLSLAHASAPFTA
jgi:pimeloyl-ACP methyl ester carboxylesterase